MPPPTLLLQIVRKSVARVLTVYRQSQLNALRSKAAEDSKGKKGRVSDFQHSATATQATHTQKHKPILAPTRVAMRAPCSCPLHGTCMPLLTPLPASGCLSLCACQSTCRPACLPVCHRHTAPVNLCMSSSTAHSCDVLIRHELTCLLAFLSHQCAPPCH